MATVLGCAPEPTASTEPVVRGGLGISGGHTWLQLDAAELDRQMGIVAQTGATWVRIDIDWSVIEPVRGEQDWSATDRAVRAARAHNLSVLAILTYAPAWAGPHGGDGGSKTAPQPVLFGRFVGDAVEHYRDQISHWEVWNEPNVTAFFAPKPDVATYAHLLRQAALAVRARQPHGQIIVGGLAPAADDGRDIAPATFVEALYAIGAGADFDAVAVHPYSYPELPESQSWYNAFGNLMRIRRIMDANHDTTMQLWPTEFGAPTGAGARAVSEDVQAQIIDQGLGMVAAIHDIGPVFVYSLVDAGGDPHDLEDNFGLLRRDYSEKPAVTVVRNHAEVLRAGR
ncbi:beta-xylosidase [Nocardia rosealba]|uniref:beta-xylosidase n=1 Tax=Nocardia rosealba TaxID=2878563 RepID=UPI001CD996D1|nr:beta-xylosidase [Nocardia rosealba]MCA2207190.1 beta-xylosidase [Nocardia rosealba]